MARSIPTASVLIAHSSSAALSCIRQAVELEERLSICCEAHDGLEALALAQRWRPRAVLIDAQIPRMDGIEIARCLAQLVPETIIVVMSPYEFLRATAMNAGAHAFVTPEDGCRALRTTIMSLLEQSDLTVARLANKARQAETAA